jgi:AcrR family transcriptional regulator
VQSTIEQICSAALGLLEAGGAQAVSMRRVASAVGITPMAIYHHFENRTALLRTVVDREFLALETAFVSQTPVGDCDEEIVRILDVYLRYALERPRVFDYMFAEPRSDARTYPADFRSGRSPTLNRLAEVLTAAMKSRKFKKDDAWEVAMDLWAHIHGHIMLYRAGRFSLSPKSFRSLVHRSIQRFLYGLKVCPSVRRARR